MPKDISAIVATFPPPPCSSHILTTHPQLTTCSPSPPQPLHLPHMQPMDHPWPPYGHPPALMQPAFPSHVHVFHRQLKATIYSPHAPHGHHAHHIQRTLPSQLTHDHHGHHMQPAHPHSSPTTHHMQPMATTMHPITHSRLPHHHTQAICNPNAPHGHHIQPIAHPRPLQPPHTTHMQFTTHARPCMATFRCTIFIPTIPSSHSLSCICSHQTHYSHYFLHLKLLPILKTHVL